MTPKKCWTILKQAIGKLNDKSSLPHTFHVNNIQVTDKREIAEGFNNFFSSIGSHTSHNVPASKKCFTSYMPRPLNHSMFMPYITPEEIITASNKLKPKTSSGHDGISSKLMKETLVKIIEPITHIINQSFQTGIVPDKMKIAKVIPIEKLSTIKPTSSLFQIVRKNNVHQINEFPTSKQHSLQTSVWFQAKALDYSSHNTSHKSLC